MRELGQNAFAHRKLRLFEQGPLRFLCDLHSPYFKEASAVPSFCASIMLPFNLSLPCMKACWPFNFPATIARKSASFMVIVQSALPASPLHNFPSFFRSNVHFPASFKSKQKIAFVFLQISGPRRCEPFARRLKLLLDLLQSSLS